MIFYASQSTTINNTGTQVDCRCMPATNNRRCHTRPWLSITSTTPFLPRWLILTSWSVWYSYEYCKGAPCSVYYIFITDSSKIFILTVSLSLAKHPSSPGWRVCLPVLPPGEYKLFVFLQQEVFHLFAPNTQSLFAVCDSPWGPSVSPLERRKRARNSSSPLRPIVSLPLDRERRGAVRKPSW